MAPEVVLLVLGAGLELGGLITVFVDLRGTGRDLEQFLHRPVTLRIASALHPLRSQGVGLVEEGPPGPPPTLEDRVAALEVQVGDLRTMVDSLQQVLPGELHTLEKRVRDEMQDVVSRLADTLREYDQALERLVVSVAVGGRWKRLRLRVVGVVLFATGLAMQTAANVLSSIGEA